MNDETKDNEQQLEQKEEVPTRIDAVVGVETLKLKSKKVKTPTEPAK